MYGFKKTRDKNGKIIIIESVIRYLMTSYAQLFTEFNKIICGSEVYIMSNNIYASIISCRHYHFQTVIIAVGKVHIRRFESTTKAKYELYINKLINGNCQIYPKKKYISLLKMCQFSNHDTNLPHWNCVVRFCIK